MVEIQCGVCDAIFSKSRNNTHLVIKTKKSDYCSRRCARTSSNGMHEESKVLKEYRI
jgi:hypothetical protein